MTAITAYEICPILTQHKSYKQPPTLTTTKLWDSLVIIPTYNEIENIENMIKTVFL